MSLVIAIKDKDRIVLGGDKQTSAGNNKDHLATKIWEVPGLPGAIMGGVGSFRASQIIQYVDLIDKNSLSNNLSIEWVVKYLAPTIYATLEANGVNCTQGEEGFETRMMPNSFLFAYEDKAWMIWNDLSVTELLDYMAIGSGADIARGVLFATPDKNPFERIITAIDAAAESTVYVDDGVDVLLTKEKPTDAKQFAKALGIEIKKVEETAQKIEEKQEAVEVEEEEKQKETTKKKKDKKEKIDN